MRYVFFLLTLVLTHALALEVELLDVNGTEAKVSIDQIDVGVSGFVVHRLADDRHFIVNSAVVSAFDPKKKEATLKLSKYTLFTNNNLPTLKLTAQKGDTAVLAYAYGRGLLIAPQESIYYTLKGAMKNETFIHPDIFATMLSYRGHPTPLQEDFEDFCNNVTLGLLFFYIEQNLYTTDCHTFRILNIQKAPLKQSEEKLPFYSRVEKIEANWFGKGSKRLEDYEPYYYELLYRNNKDNKALKEAILHSADANVSKLAHDLDLEDEQ